MAEGWEWRRDGRGGMMGMAEVGWGGGMMGMRKSGGVGRFGVSVWI